jgi:Ca2+/Na+ antiporter
MKKKSFHLFFMILGIIAIVACIFLLKDSYERTDNTRMIMRGLILVLFIIWTISHARNYKKETEKDL